MTSNDVNVTTLHRIDVSTTSCAYWEFAPPCPPPNILNLALPPNILNLPMPMLKSSLTSGPRTSIIPYSYGHLYFEGGNFEA